MKRLICSALLICTLQTWASAEWDITWYSIDSGGGLAATGGVWELSGTVGQPDATEANAAVGGTWTLTGGFWSWLAEYLDVLFSDRFEGG